MVESDSVHTASSDGSKLASLDGLDMVAVLAGGQSAEREISLKSGEAMFEALEEAPARRVMLDPGSDLPQRLREEEVDCAVIALHGRGGEDGQVQAVLDWLGIPYTGPSMAPSARSMDKLFSKRLFRQGSIPTPDWVLLRDGESAGVPDRLGEKLVVKPRFEGSSLGMSIVPRTDLPRALEEARRYDSDVLIEEYIDGYEATVGIVTLESTRVLPPVGIRPGHEFFDYDTKYTKGMTEYDVPADLPDTTIEALKEISLEAARHLETLELCRVDLMVPDSGSPTVLEINTIPGFTETSLLPKAARAEGISFPELVWGMVRSSVRRARERP